MHFIKNLQRCGLSDFVFKRFEEFTKAHSELLSNDSIKKKETEYIFSYRIGGFWNAMLTWAANNADLSPKDMAIIISKV